MWTWRCLGCLLHLLMVSCISSAAEETCAAPPKPPARTRNLHRNLRLQYYTTEATRAQLNALCLQRSRLARSGAQMSDSQAQQRLTNYLYSCQRQQRVFEQQQLLTDQQSSDSRVGITAGRVIKREHSDQLSYARFIQEYQQQGQPVVVQGMARRMLPSGDFSIKGIIAACGSRPVKPLYPASSPQWLVVQQRSPVSDALWSRGGMDTNAQERQLSLAQFMNRTSDPSSDSAEQG